jgi:2Fe-2S ferredoxin
VDESWVDKVGTPDDVERDMLEFVIDPQPTSRLSCQIKISDSLEGLVVRLPESQF